MSHDTLGTQVHWWSFWRFNAATQNIVMASVLSGAYMACAAQATTAVADRSPVVEPTSAHPEPTNDDQPEYWIERLAEPAERSRAIAQLSVLSEDALYIADNQPQHPKVRALVDKVLQPLSRAYIEHYHELDEVTKERAIATLASFRDPRASPAFEKAFDEFAKSGSGGREVKRASLAVRELKLHSSAQSLFRAFKKTRPSTKDGAYYRDVSEALLSVPEPAWSGELVSMVDADFPAWDRTQNPSAETISNIRDTAYRTITAARVLGELRDPAAVRPLIKLLLDPTRADVAGEALMALTKIGRPSVDAAVLLLNNDDQELVEYHKERVRRATGVNMAVDAPFHLAMAAAIIGAVGRSEGIAPLLAALSEAKGDDEKVPLLAALAMLPHSPEVTSTFRSAFKALSNGAKYQGESAVVALSESATLFFDPSFTEILVAKGLGLKSDKVAMSLLALAAMKTMDGSQIKSVKRLLDAIPPETEDRPQKEQLKKLSLEFGLTVNLLQVCKDDPVCYISEAEKAENQTSLTQMTGLKALYMVGQLRGPESTHLIVKAMRSFHESSLRHVAAQLIDHNHPAGSTEVANQLQVIVNENLDSMDTSKIAADKPLRDAITRLQSRAR